MRVKSRKPPAEYLITSIWVTVLEIGGGADDVVGDQMRQMAGDREDQIVVLGVIGSTFAPSAARIRISRSTAAGSVLGAAE